MRKEPRWKQETLHDRHLGRHGHRLPEQLHTAKGGAGKGNWGTTTAELVDLSIREGSPFEDDSAIYPSEPNHHPEMEPKIQIALAPVDSSI
jgi:hypothetical protein